ncbi:hypothetical protein FRB94_000608 [Tulasnella sp. JGI-2019a]|nr:hypothetical protein FRB94_000608 [Tulasnella sp. JGI-2019a]
MLVNDSYIMGLSSWTRVFEQDLLAKFGNRAKEAVNKIIADIEKTAPVGLINRCAGQREQALTESKAAMDQLISAAGAVLRREQKEASRCFAPHIKMKLRPGYQEAARMTGREDIIFLGGSGHLLTRLREAAENVGSALETELTVLAQRVEVVMVVLWEGGTSTRAQLVHRCKTHDMAAQISQKLQYWIIAE